MVNTRTFYKILKEASIGNGMSIKELNKLTCKNVRI